MRNPACVEWITRTSRVMTVFLLLILPLQARAAQFTGEYLLYVCASDKNGKELVAGGHATCQAYISGVLDYNTLIQSLGTAPSVDFCVPKDVKLNVLQKYVYAYIFKYRVQHSKFIAAPAVALALHNKYPCK